MREKIVNKLINFLKKYKHIQMMKKKYLNMD